MRSACSKTPDSLPCECRWVDPLGAIIISVYIVWRWVVMCKGQVSRHLQTSHKERVVQQMQHRLYPLTSLQHALSTEMDLSMVA
jgi:Co/Zn/Cd efflux system component